MMCQERKIGKETQWSKIRQDPEVSTPAPSCRKAPQQASLASNSALYLVVSILKLQ